MLSDTLDMEQLRRTFDAYGRVHIPEVLQAHVLGPLVREIQDGIDWRLSLNSGTKGLSLPLSDLASLEAEAAHKLDEMIYAQAATGFQYRFDAYALSDEVEAGRCPYPNLKGVYDYLNSPAFLGFIGDLTGSDLGQYCDAQVTRYRPGHFLTTHSDLHETKQRLFAYVLNLSPPWRTDWGGLLQLIASDGHISEAYTPTMNALNIFRVPQPHAVSYVAPFAAANRVSITGWVRVAGDNPLSNQAARGKA